MNNCLLKVFLSEKEQNMWKIGAMKGAFLPSFRTECLIWCCEIVLHPSIITYLHWPRLAAPLRPNSWSTHLWWDFLSSVNRAKPLWLANLWIWWTLRLTTCGCPEFAMDPRACRGLVVTSNAYFSLLTHTKQLLLVTFYDNTAGIGASFWTHRWTDARTEGQTDVEVDTVI